MFPNFVISSLRVARIRICVRPDTISSEHALVPGAIPMLSKPLAGLVNHNLTGPGVDHTLLACQDAAKFTEYHILDHVVLLALWWLGIVGSKGKGSEG